jgi:hypothetical protein
MTVAQAGMLQRSQNYCMRYVYGLRRDEHIMPCYIEANILKLHDQRAIKILSLLFSILKTNFPKYFTADFKFVSQDSVRISCSSSITLRIPHHVTSVYDRAFVVTACRLWNTHIRSLDKRSQFVATLKKTYLEQMVLVGVLVCPRLPVLRDCWCMYAWVYECKKKIYFIYLFCIFVL